MSLVIKTLTGVGHCQTSPPQPASPTESNLHVWARQPTDNVWFCLTHFRFRSSVERLPYVIFCRCGQPAAATKSKSKSKSNACQLNNWTMIMVWSCTSTRVQSRYSMAPPDARRKSRSRISAMSIVDEETRQLILRKTWCHGQSILPIYSVVLLAWWWHLDKHPAQLVLASLVLPLWAWYSYQWVFVARLFDVFIVPHAPFVLSWMLYVVVNVIITPTMYST